MWAINNMLLPVLVLAQTISEHNDALSFSIDITAHFLQSAVRLSTALNQPILIYLRVTVISHPLFLACVINT